MNEEDKIVLDNQMRPRDPNAVKKEHKPLLPAVFVPEDKTYEISLRSPYGDPLGIEQARQDMLIGMIRALAYKSFEDNKYQEALEATPEAEQLQQLNGSRFRGDTINRLRGTNDFEPEQWYEIVDNVAYPCAKPSILQDPDEVESCSTIVDEDGTERKPTMYELNGHRFGPSAVRPENNRLATDADIANHEFLNGNEGYVETVDSETRYPSDEEEKRGHIKYEHMHQNFGNKRRKQIRDKGRAAKKARRVNRK